jgi:hypothetical protein
MEKNLDQIMAGVKAGIQKGGVKRTEAFDIIIDAFRGLLTRYTPEKHAETYNKLRDWVKQIDPGAVQEFNRRVGDVLDNDTRDVILSSRILDDPKRRYPDRLSREADEFEKREKAERGFFRKLFG